MLKGAPEPTDSQQKSVETRVEREPMRSSVITRFAILCAGVALLLVACSPAQRAPAGRVFDVRIKDFKVLPSSPSLSAGPVTFNVSNSGPTTHEFVVVRTDLPEDDLPIGTDGLSVDEDGLEPVDEIHGIEDGTSGQVTARLQPGNYVFFCNFEGHYLAGMHAGVEVTEDV
jgi:uncharacterized cupredoxin-like copper-binding protein